MTRRVASKGKCTKKFCDLTCFRKHRNNRFERNLKDPAVVAHPKSYGEFLDSGEKIACLVDGCDWMGKNLSLHMNYSHGISADDFKKAAGFNRSTGVVCRELSERMSQHSLSNCELESFHLIAPYRHPYANSQPISPEAIENRGNANAIIDLRGRGRKISATLSTDANRSIARQRLRDRISSGKNTRRNCLFCSMTFLSLSVGRSRYCSKKCQLRAREDRESRQAFCTLECSHCGKSFMASKRQASNKAHGKGIYCSAECKRSRQILMWKAWRKSS